jgi:PucR C-terminal helix-turn-helix domain
MISQELPLERPWRALDAEVGRVVEPVIGSLAGEIAAAIGASIEEYREPLRGAFGRAVRAAIYETLRQFVEQIGRPAEGVRPGRDVYVDLGRGECRAGRTLDALQAAYRLGARVAWRRIAAVARDAGLDSATLALLAESIFAYIDELSAESVEGYASEQAALAGERQRARQALVRQLIDGELDPAEAVQAARAVDWSPRRVAVLVAEHRDPERLVRLLGAGAIGAHVDGLACVLLGDPDGHGRRESLIRSLAGRLAALGPTVTLAAVPRSWALAARAARLARAGVLPGDRLVIADEALPELVLFADEELVGELARARLEPLAGLTAAGRARLEATLRSWLRHHGAVAAVAAELHVHPQTVRYRLARLRECFGAQLDDPEARFELELALRARCGFTGSLLSAPSNA